MSARGGFRQTVRDVLLTPSGLAGLLIILTVLGLSITALVYVPFDVVREWNNPPFWQDYPRLAAPSWVSFLSGTSLPQSIVLTEDVFLKQDYTVSLIGMKYIMLTTKFEFNYDEFPSELGAVLRVRYDENRPLVTMRLIRPDGIEVVLYHAVVASHNTTLYISADEAIKRRVADFLTSAGSAEPRVVYPEVALFAARDANMWDPSKATVLKGSYRVRVDVTATEPSTDITAGMIIYGRVYGIAGTDSKRRDLLVGLIWGAPVALTFGLSAAVLTSLIQSLMGALSAWYGGIIDEGVQRVTDIFLIMPFLPILITVSVIYRIDIWTLCLIVVLLSVLGGLTKTARSMTLQVMNEQYVEAATSYGASRSRVLFLYIMPRLMPYIVANIVLSVPAFVFLEAAMSVLGLGDPRVPTWGKIIGDAYDGGAAIHGFWWWILLPALLIILTAAAFALIGYALDKIVNPRLRER